jgi:RNA 3'-terminal phosphate cyclase (ATP)
MITIDASLGEGGGQVLRSSLTLAILSEQAVHLTNIRAKRSKPGLQAQHLQAVKAAAAICDGNVTGASIGSQTLHFEPGTVKAGNYRFEIGTAGAATLVLQTIFLPLSRATGKSTVVICGGTHVAWSPSYHYLDWLWLPCLRTLGYDAELTLEQAGFYPQGNGRIRAVIRPSAAIQPLQRVERGALLSIRGLSGVGNLDEEIAHRQKLQALRRLEPLCRETKIKAESVQAFGKGTFVALLAAFEQGQACFTSLGAPGKRAEHVADEAADDLQAFLAATGAVDPHLADQLLLPLSLANGPSHFTTSIITQHLLTNAEIIRQFGMAHINIEGKLGENGVVDVHPKPIVKKTLSPFDNSV